VSAVRHHPVTPDTFGPVFEWARARESRIAEATSPWDGGDSQTSYWLADDFASGFALRPTGGGVELRYVFSVTRGRGDSIVASAVAQGADVLDCFDGYLPTLYARHGFVETHREPNYTPGGPDVVFMVRV
jgi:hypothetical protein